MPDLDSRLVAALQEQRRHRDARLRRGARQVGWKLGMGRREKIGEQIAIGYLTSDTVVGHACRYAPPAGADDRDLHVDAELCVELERDINPEADSDSVRAAIGSCWPALEIVDLAPRAGEPDSIVAENVFHLAVAFSETLIPLESRQHVIVYVNHERQESAPWPADIPDRIASAAAILAGLDERLRAGDRIITGSIIQVPTTIGDLIEAEFGDHASIDISLTDHPDI